FKPNDLGRAVELANAFVAASGRPVDWIHIPVLDTSDETFFAPLQNLQPQGARVYLGAIHNMPRFKARIATARKYLRDFGASCKSRSGPATWECSTLPSTASSAAAMSFV